MISINKQGNAIVIEFTDNDKYLFNGKIEVAPNELIVVVDQSDMVTFKRASNGDVLFSQLVDDIQIAGSPVTKDTVIDQFAIIGFTSGGGGGAGGAVSSVNGQTGDVIITPASLNVYTRAEVDDAINAETTERQKQDSALGGMIAAETAAREQAVASKQDTLVSGTNIKTINGQTLLGNGNIEIQGGELPIATADTLGGIKVGAGLSINPGTGVLSATGGGTADSVEWDNVLSKPDDIVNITERLAAKLDTATYNSEKANFATKDELNSKADASAIADMATQTWVQGQGYLTEVPSNYVTETELSGKGYLTSIPEEYVTNEELTSALSSKQDKGDYATTAQLANKVDVSVYTEDKATFATKAELNLKANTSDLSNYLQTSVADEKYATKTELEGKVDDADIADMLTKTEASEKYQPKGEYATTSQLSGKQDTLVSGTNIKTINGNSLLGEGDITIQAGGTVDTEMSDTSENAVQNKVIKKYIDDLVGNILTQLQEINGTN